MTANRATDIAEVLARSGISSPSVNGDAPAIEPRTLAEVVEVFQKWLAMPDASALYVALATVVANRASGDPVWTILVGPPGCGKSEILTALVGLPDVYPVATITEAGLLSGTPKRENAKNATGGLLRSIGDDGYGLVLLKDLGSVLSMNRDTRAATLAALREVYDGSWTRLLGTDGGRTLHWHGKVGLVAGCTPTLDSHHGVMASMGERFAIFRVPSVDASDQAACALSRGDQDHEMRAELATAVRGLLDNLDGGDLEWEAADRDGLVSLSVLAVRCRSAVERDGYSREIELIPEAEAPARLARVLARLLAALVIVGVERSEAWRIVRKVALDSMPAIRRAVLEHLALVSHANAPAIAIALGYPTTTTRRALEDLAAHRVVVRDQTNSADLWSMTHATAALWRVAVPETLGQS